MTRVVAAAAVAGAGFLISPAAAGPAVIAASVTSTATPTATPTTTPAPTTAPTTPPPTTPPPTTAPPTTPPPTTTPPGAEGCTPGYWKNHPESFAGTGYATDDTVGEVFTSLAGTSVGDLTLIEALNLGDGGLNALLRQAVAALLNASSPEVDYPLDAATVIALTNAAVLSGQYEATKNLLDQYNNFGAPGFCD